MVPIDRQGLVLLMEAGYVYLGLTLFDEAREVFEGITVLAPNNEIPHVAIGTSFFAQMKYDKAVQSYRKALKIKQDSAYARAFLGEALFFLGKREEALSELEKALLLDPQGTSGAFAKSLKDAIKNGFVPPPHAGKH
ncbi:MAG: tetratricopeptide repeat protein [Deltaproteobacteria bacterium]|nr:tetratricopeptide repeat protein [Deltaproteobacteria bacterium]